MRPALAAIALCATLGAGADDARACSLEFSGWLGVAHGTSIPRSGTLYAASYAGREPTESTGAAWTSRVIAEHGSYLIVAYDYRATGPTLEIEVRSSWSLTVDDGWRPPADPPRVVTIWHKRTEGCGGEELLALQLDQPVAAVRVRWKGPDGAVEHVLPTYSSGHHDETRSTVLHLGQDPYVETLNVEVLRRGGTLELVAIRFDGSEVAIAGVPERIALDDYPVAANTTPLYLQPPVIEYAARKPGPAGTSTRTLIILAGLAALGALVVVGLVLRGRPRS